MTIDVGTSREYNRIHYMARKTIGAACEECGSTEAIQAALRHDAEPARLRIDATTGCAYSTDVTDYHALCVACHRRRDLVDGRPECSNGHEYTPENTSIRSDGSRRCLTCHREQESARNEAPSTRAAKNARDREYREANPMTKEQKDRKLELQRKRRAAARSARFEHGESGPR